MPNTVSSECSNQSRDGEQVEILGEQEPDPAAVGLHFGAIAARDAEPLQLYALRIEHAGHIVVGLHEEGRGIGKRRVLGIPGGIGVAVRRNDRQAGDAVVKPAGDVASRRLDRKKPVGMQRHFPPSVSFLFLSGCWMRQTRPVGKSGRLTG
jgi:hypothetical protein